MYVCVHVCVYITTYVCILTYHAILTYTVKHHWWSLKRILAGNSMDYLDCQPTRSRLAYKKQISIKTSSNEDNTDNNMGVSKSQSSNNIEAATEVADDDNRLTGVHEQNNKLPSGDTGVKELNLKITHKQSVDK